jgi:putative dimethyl sulfoxide reductase chaperone
MELTHSLVTKTMPAATVLAPSAVFGLLASMYLCKPTADAIGNWRNLMSGGVPEALGDLSEALERINLNSVEEMQDLLWDFTRMFIGPYRLPCPPWESVYTSPKRLLLQESSDAVRAVYDRLGIEVAPNVLPDHVGAELNFMGILLERIETGSSEEAAYRQFSKDFVEEHLKNWIPRFASDLEKAAETSLYKALARSTITAVELFSENSLF